MPMPLRKLTSRRGGRSLHDRFDAVAGGIFGRRRLRRFGSGGAWPEVDDPGQQRKGLPLIGWWLAGIPQYTIAGVSICSGGAAASTASTRSWGGCDLARLIWLLVLVAVIVLLFRGEYPRSISISCSASPAGCCVSSPTPPS
jgi:hypothetical protein